MGVVFALEALFAEVKTQVEASWQGLVTVEWGQTRLPVELNINKIGRVLFVPASPDGDLGAVTDGEQWPQPAQTLLQLDELFTVYVFAREPLAQIQEDMRHDHKFLLALSETLRQLHNATHHHPAITSPIKIGKLKMLKPLSVTCLGRECMIPCQTQQPILDLFDGTLTTERVYPQMDLTDTINNNHSEESWTQPEGS